MTSPKRARSLFLSPEEAELLLRDDVRDLLSHTRMPRTSAYTQQKALIVSAINSARESQVSISSDASTMQAVERFTCDYRPPSITLNINKELPPPPLLPTYSPHLTPKPSRGLSLIRKTPIDREEPTHLKPSRSRKGNQKGYAKHQGNPYRADDKATQTIPIYGEFEKSTSAAQPKRGPTSEGTHSCSDYRESLLSRVSTSSNAVEVSLNKKRSQRHEGRHEQIELGKIREEEGHDLPKSEKLPQVSRNKATFWPPRSGTLVPEATSKSLGNTPQGFKFWEDESVRIVERKENHSNAEDMQVIESANSDIEQQCSQSISNIRTVGRRSKNTSLRHNFNNDLYLRQNGSTRGITRKARENGSSRGSLRYSFHDGLTIRRTMSASQRNTRAVSTRSRSMPLAYTFHDGLYNRPYENSQAITARHRSNTICKPRSSLPVKWSFHDGLTTQRGHSLISRTDSTSFGFRYSFHDGLTVRSRKPDVSLQAARNRSTVSKDHTVSNTDTNKKAFDAKLRALSQRPYAPGQVGSRRLRFTFFEGLTFKAVDAVHAKSDREKHLTFSFHDGLTYRVRSIAERSADTKQWIYTFHEGLTKKTRDSSISNKKLAWTWLDGLHYETKGSKPLPQLPKPQCLRKDQAEMAKTSNLRPECTSKLENETENSLRQVSKLSQRDTINLCTPLRNMQPQTLHRGASSSSNLGTTIEDRRDKSRSRSVSFVNEIVMPDAIGSSNEDDLMTQRARGEHELSDDGQSPNGIRKPYWAIERHKNDRRSRREQTGELDIQDGSPASDDVAESRSITPEDIENALNAARSMSPISEASVVSTLSRTSLNSGDVSPKTQPRRRGERKTRSPTNQDHGLEPTSITIPPAVSLPSPAVCTTVPKSISPIRTASNHTIELSATSVSLRSFQDSQIDRSIDYVRHFSTDSLSSGQADKKKQPQKPSEGFAVTGRRPLCLDESSKIVDSVSETRTNAALNEEIADLALEQHNSFAIGQKQEEKHRSKSRPKGEGNRDLKEYRRNDSLERHRQKSLEDHQGKRNAKERRVQHKSDGVECPDSLMGEDDVNGNFEGLCDVGGYYGGDRHSMYSLDN